MKAFINGISSISPQNTFESNHFLESVIQYETNAFKCLEPDYKLYINPTLIRRMGRIIKMGVASAQVCLKDADVLQPDAILTGTGLGCIEDTEKFLSAILLNQEQFLTPTSFIQSTHNTVGGQIALLLKCNNYNITYVHRGFSFESALLDALMLINEKESRNILLGAVDENTINSIKLFERLGQLKRKPISNTALIESKTRGTIAGEGANFFLLSAEQTKSTYGVVLGLKMMNKPANYAAIETQISNLLQQNQLNDTDIDIVVYGANGDAKMDLIYTDLMQNKFPTSTSAYFKHLSGEFMTANSFGFWMVAQMLKTQTIPQQVVLSNKNRQAKHILLYNHYRGINHVAILFKAC
jgi:3-oxoacyl-[acyl-carrier-protein] synthase II